jgi:hypothetical protein
VSSCLDCDTSPARFSASCPSRPVNGTSWEYIGRVWSRLMSEPSSSAGGRLHQNSRPPGQILTKGFQSGRVDLPQQRPQRVDLDRRYAVPTSGEMSVLGGCGCEAGDQLAAYLSRLDDGINDQLARQPQDVDV